MSTTRRDYDTPSREDVEFLVRAFLDAPMRESKRGRFAEVPEGNVGALDTLIRALVKYRYEPDPDGDRPVQWQLSDWTREEPHHFASLPRFADDGSNTEERLDVALMNLAMANATVQRVHDVRRALRNTPKEQG